MGNFQERANFIWQVADDILRGVFKNYEYGDVVLPFTVLRRLDCVLEPTKEQVIGDYERFQGLPEAQLSPILFRASRASFYNTSHFDLRRLAQDAPNIAINFNKYLAATARTCGTLSKILRLGRWSPSW
jgi:type I restriction enzyme M protein